MLKIIGGSLKHRQILTPKGTGTRPTSSLVRKAIFDICQFEIEDADFLDVYAGSGAMGIEALSRGAKSATFVDSERFAIECIKQNLQELNLQGQVLKLDALKAIHYLAKTKALFDIIYVDPPYAKDVAMVLKALDELGLLKADGKLFLEHRTATAVDFAQLQHLKLDSERKFGDTQIFILTYA